MDALEAIREALILASGQRSFGDRRFQSLRIAQGPRRSAARAKALGGPMMEPRLHGDTKVSVIINNYNYGHFLGAAIDSALTQTYASIEVVVVDDGSTDDSRKVIAGYGSRIC